MTNLHIPQHTGVFAVVVTTVGCRTSLCYNVAVMDVVASWLTIRIRTFIGQAITIDLNTTPQATVRFSGLTITQITNSTENDRRLACTFGNYSGATRNPDVVFRILESEIGRAHV